MQTARKTRLDNNALLGIMFLSALIGDLLGGLAYLLLKNDSNAVTGALLSAYAASGSPGKVFIDSFCMVSAFVTAEFLLGFCSLAQPLELAVPAVFGLGSGVILPAVYSEARYSGSYAAAALTALSLAFSGFCIAASACGSVRLSTRLMSHVMSPLSSDGMLASLRTYCGRFFLIEILCTAAAGLRAAAYIL